MGILDTLAFIFFFSSRSDTNQQATTSCRHDTTGVDDFDQDSHACDHITASWESDNCNHLDDD